MNRLEYSLNYLSRLSTPLKYWPIRLLLAAPFLWLFYNTFYPPTLGRIYVDSPQVYTRERLVNDRFAEEAWLNFQLDRTRKLLDDGSFDGVEGRRLRHVEQTIGGTANLLLGIQQPLDRKELAAKAIEAVKEVVDKPIDAVMASPIDTFRDAQSYREAIRTELMSTLLDDRHDIDGNTLYRLNFDVTVHPGNNTQAAAIVRIALAEDDAKALRNYADLYSDWHQSLQEDIDSAVRAQTYDLTQSRGQNFSDLDKLMFQEFLENNICRQFWLVATHFIFLPQKPHDYPIPSQKRPIELSTACDKIDLIRGREIVRNAIGLYVYGYMAVLNTRNNREYLKEVADVVDKGGVKTVGTVPATLCQGLLAVVPGAVAACPRSWPVGDPRRNAPSPMGLDQILAPRHDSVPESEAIKEAIGSAIGFARSQRGCRPLDAGSDKAGEAPQERNFVLGELSFPCPPEIGPGEELFGAITLYSRLQQLTKSHTRPKQEAARYGLKNIESAILTLACVLQPYLNKPTEHCSFEQGIKIIDVLALYPEKQFGGTPGPPTIGNRVVGELVATAIEAKLNDELNSYKVSVPLNKMFSTTLSGCEMGTCTLILRPWKLGEREGDGDCEAARRQTGYSCEAIRLLEETLNRGAQTFSYNVGPTEIVQRIASEDATRINLLAALRAAGGGDASALEVALDTVYRFEDRIEVRHRNPIVVGFGEGFGEGSGATDSGKALAQTEFGWLIRPRLMPKDDAVVGEHNRQIAQHYSLSAIVSVPSWWQSLKLTVSTRWSDQKLELAKLDPGDSILENVFGASEKEKCIDDLSSDRTCKTYYVEVPGSVKEIDDKLKYEVRKEPYIEFASTMSRGEQYLEIGRPGQLILEGGRLWRGTVVTVGDQRADIIKVLPDMNGVSAEFVCVKPPPGHDGWSRLEQQEVVQRVTVWTSEGRTSTPFIVHLKPFKRRMQGASKSEVSKTGEPVYDQPCFLEIEAK